MKGIHLNDISYPSSFFMMFSKSVQIYRTSAFNYILLSLIVYLPLLVVERLGRSDFVFLIELVHSSFLDILVFLSLPTLIIYKKIYPLETIQIFLMRFFASAVILSIIQLMLSFLGIWGFIPYIFILFSGFFLVIENSSEIINVRKCLIQSVKTVRNFIIPVSWNYLLITIITTIPVSMFAIWYFSDHQKLWEAIRTLDTVRENNTISIQQLINTTLALTQEPKFILGRLLLHIVFRPLKSIFIAVLFISLMHRLNPVRIDNFLSIKSQGTSPGSPTKGL